MRLRKKGLRLEVTALRAADLALPETSRGKMVNAALVAKFNGSTKRTKRKPDSNNPSWDTKFTFLLRPGDSSEFLTLAVWSKLLRSKTYLGERRFRLSEVFANGVFRTNPAWYKLYSNDHEHTFVTGSILVQFELVESDRSASPSELLSRLSIDDSDPLAAKFAAWLDSLICQVPSGAATPNDQDFYEDSMSEFSAESGVSIDLDSSNHLKVTASPEHLSDASSYHSLSSANSVKKRRFKARPSNYQLQNRSVRGVLFLEIIQVTDLPPLKNFTKTSFDMDPFVVVAFGKKTFRTSWKRHTLNPVFNERLAFEVMANQSSYNIQFNVLDKDRFSFHDKVADVCIPVTEIINLAKEQEDFLDVPEVDEKEVSTRPQGSLSDAAPANPSVKVSLDDANLVKTSKKRKFRKRRFTFLYVDTSLFKTLDLALTFRKQELHAKHSPSIKVRARFISYENLRRDFWRIVLDQFNVDETPGLLDFIEFISLLDTLGSPNSDEIVTKIFEKYQKSPWGGDVVSHEEAIDALEEFVNSTDRKPDEKLFEIEKCPICQKKRLSKKEDNDIITHVAICASKDWSIVNKLLMLSFATPQAATKRWFTKVLIKLTYGKYQLGSNSANILVQDRLTGIIMEEKMNVSVRLGIRLLYKGLDKAKSRRVRSLLRKLSIKQGLKFDSPQLRADIASFIKFHKLDLSECQITDPSGFQTFNDFFYRKLKPGARKVDAPDEDRVVTSPADCRCTTFTSVNEATEFWIKGRNFTIAKLFNGNYNGLENTDIYDPANCCIGIFRLAPQDYHRFHSPVSGTIGPIKYIDGEYYTVNPMAIRSALDVYGENVRVIIPIKTKHFGTVVMVAVGAMMVGSTLLTVEEGQHVNRGDEVGYFKFGGSTVLVLFEKKRFQFDKDLVSNSTSKIETLVRVGQSIGHSPEIDECHHDHVDFEKQSKNYKLNLIRALTGGDLSNLTGLDSWEAQNMRLDHKDAVLLDLDSESE